MNSLVSRGREAAQPTGWGSDMRSIKTRLVWTLAIATIVAAASPAVATALTLREGSAVQVASGEVISDDLYAFGDTITIDGTVDGDVVAFGQIVLVNGEVRGTLISAAQTVRVAGSVGGSARLAGAIVDVTGDVAGDVLAGAGQVVISGDVQRDLAAGAQAVAISGAVGRNVLVGSSDLTISGTVGGDVHAESNRVTVTSEGEVSGDLDYWSTADAEVQGTVSGQTTRHEPPEQERRTDGGADGAGGAIVGVILAWAQSFVGFALLGVVLVFAFTRATRAGSQAAIARVWPSLGVGLAVFFGTPMAVAFVFVAGLFIGAWWLSFVLAAVYWLLLLAGMVIGSLAIGRAILGKTRSTGEPALAWSVLLGLVLVWIAAAVPVLGWLAAWAVMVAGTGALVLAWLGKDAPPLPAPVTAGVPATPPSPPFPGPPPSPPSPGPPGA